MDRSMSDLLWGIQTQFPEPEKTACAPTSRLPVYARAAGPPAGYRSRLEHFLVAPLPGGLWQTSGAASKVRHMRIAPAGVSTSGTAAIRH